MARLIRDARYSDRGLAGDLREAWGERVAICTIDGGLTEGQAEVVALGQVERMHALGAGLPPATAYKLPQPDAPSVVIGAWRVVSARRRGRWGWT